MQDKDKLWIGIKLVFPEHFDNIVEVLESFSKYTENYFDDSVKTLILHEFDNTATNVGVNVFCVYDPNNADDDKYSQFFEDAKEYIKKFNETINTPKS